MPADVCWRHQKIGFAPEMMTMMLMLGTIIVVLFMMIFSFTAVTIQMLC